MFVGLLTVHFSPLWDDSVSGLQKVAEVNPDAVLTLAFEWLNKEGTSAPRNDMTDKTESTSALKKFECSSLLSVERQSLQAFSEFVETSIKLESAFEEALKPIDLPIDIGRSQALRVLCGLPQVAQRRSRQLVPLLLAWVRIGDPDDQEAGEEESPMGWARKDRISMLTLFSKFVNPKALYRSEALYEAFLHLLKSGDGRVQSLTLKCILTWNSPAVRPYDINLDNLLDDTRFRDEITNFIQVDESESLIQKNHREQLMPILLRILYGRSLSRKNANSGSKGMDTRRTVILSSLANFSDSERELYIDIALGDLAKVDFVNKSNPENFQFNNEVLKTSKISTRKQVGFIKMAQDMLKQLGSKLLPSVPKLLDTLLYTLVASGNMGKDDGENDIGEEEDEEDAAPSRVSKSIRQGGLRVLIGLFTSCPTFHWKPYLPGIFHSLITPRLELLPTEVSQAPSGVLQLFSTWANSHHTILYLAKFNDTVIKKLAECMANPFAKDEVVKFIMKIFLEIAEIACSDNTELLEVPQAVKVQILQPNIDFMLTKIAEILQRSPSKEILEIGIEAVSRLAPFVSEGVETTRLVNITVFLLNQPSKRVSPRTKSDIVKILRHFLPLCIMEKGDELFEKTFNSISSLFGYFKDRFSREMLGAVMGVIATRDGTLLEVASLCQKLNSFSRRRIDEPDFEQRIQAYAIITEEKYAAFTPRQWMPLVYNMLYFIKDNEELAIRTNASYALRRVAEVCGQKWGTEEGDGYLKILDAVMLPAIRTGVRDPSELVRAEYVHVMSHIVKHCREWKEVSDMQVLLVGDDEEANFFNNILHIQQHRRARALRRLATSATNDGLQSSNIAHFFLPLIEHYVFDQDGGEAHTLASESILAIGHLAEQLTWTQFKALFKRYVGYMKTKKDMDKTIIRLVGIVVDSVSRAWMTSPNNPARTLNIVDNTAVDAEGDVTMDQHMSSLSEAMPTQEKLGSELVASFLPVLKEYLHQKDESTVSLRVPVAVSLIKLLKLLPDDLMQQKLPGVLTDVCHILKSRAQDARDMTRKTLTEITELLGPKYFLFILKELRGALLRGYQLHVLSFTMHTILVTVIPTYAPGDLDYCLPEMVDIIMDDIFGATGMEKDADGYISKMREVKSKKSYDSMELLAQSTSLPNLRKLIRPISSILQESLTLKLVKKVDELLRRLGLGLVRNPAVNSRDTLMFCYEIFKENYEAATVVTKPAAAEDEQTRRYIINLKNPGKALASTAPSSHLYKLDRFSLDILKIVLTKYEGLMTPENLHGLIVLIGESVLSKHEELSISALRLLTTVIRVQLPSIDYTAPVFVKQCIAFIKSCSSTNAQLAQASLKLMAAILRERPSVIVRDSAIAYVLTRIKPDLEEPDRQGITFNFIKAVLKRKISIPELYEILDSVAQVMVTNQTRAVRDLARGTYLQFLMEYPQGPKRLKKQYAFLIQNLDYVHQSGRASVLECVNTLLVKIGDKMIQEVISTFFVPIVMVLINDDWNDCREMAGQLLRKMMERADNERASSFITLIRQWLGQGENKVLVRAGLQLYCYYFEVYEVRGVKEVGFASEIVLEFLENASYNNDPDVVPTDWELVYFSLQTWAIIVRLFPEVAFSGESMPMWKAIQECLSFPHSWIRLASARLTGLFSAEFAKAPIDVLPLRNEKGLQFHSDEMFIVARKCAGQLNSLELTEELAVQVVKNLLFLGRCFQANNLRCHHKAFVDEEQEEQDSDDDDGNGSQVNGPAKGRKSALLWLMGRISRVIRNESNVRKVRPPPRYLP